MSEKKQKRKRIVTRITLLGQLVSTTSKTTLEKIKEIDLLYCYNKDYDILKVMEVPKTVKE